MAHDAIRAHARDELGITEAFSARPIQAAIASGASFAACSQLTRYCTMHATAVLRCVFAASWTAGFGMRKRVCTVPKMILQTKNPALIERYKRFWVQAINSSGIQQSEYEETGETALYSKDGDKDGIAPVFASRVEILTP